jgi:hypothetical protein
VQELIQRAESILEVNPTISQQELENERENLQIAIEEKEELDRSIALSTSESNFLTPTSIFRSHSLNTEELFTNSKPYFTPNATTEYLMNNCFPKFFSENEGRRSRHLVDYDQNSIKRYRQLWHLFGNSCIPLTRADLISGLLIAAENWIFSDEKSNQIAQAYTLKKLISAKGNFDRLVGIDKFVVGAQVDYTAPRISMILTPGHVYPATIDALTSDGKYMITLDNDPQIPKDEYVAEFNTLVLRERNSSNELSDNFSNSSAVVDAMSCREWNQTDAIDILKCLYNR